MTTDTWITVGVSAGVSLLVSGVVAVLSHWLANSRDRRSENRQSRRERLHRSIEAAQVISERLPPLINTLVSDSPLPPLPRLIDIDVFAHGVWEFLGDDTPDEFQPTLVNLSMNSDLANGIDRTQENKEKLTSAVAVVFTCQTTLAEISP